MRTIAFLMALVANCLLGWACVALHGLGFALCLAAGLKGSTSSDNLVSVLLVGAGRYLVFAAAALIPAGILVSIVDPKRFGDPITAYAFLAAQVGIPLALVGWILIRIGEFMGRRLGDDQ